MLPYRLMVLLAATCFQLLSAQDGWQTFRQAGFRVRCACELYTNQEFLRMGGPELRAKTMGAFICAENEDSETRGVIYNINVYEESELFDNGLSDQAVADAYLKQYARNLANAGMSYRYINYQGVRALEYSFLQLEVLPTKALFFLKDRRSYLLQVGTRSGLEAKFGVLKSSFQLL